MKKTIFWIIGLLIIAALTAVIILRAAPAVPPEASPDTISADDTTGTIEDELLETDLNNLDQEFAEIDQLLNQL